MAVFIGATKSSDSEKRISLKQLNSLGNKIQRIEYRPNGKLYVIPIATVMKSSDDKEWIVVPASVSREKFLMSAQQIYVYGKRGKDYKAFKTAKATQNYIENLKEF